MLYAIAATTAQRIEHPGTGATSPNAYFVMVGPLEPQRAYHPWLPPSPWRTRCGTTGRRATLWFY